MEILVCYGTCWFIQRLNSIFSGGGLFVYSKGLWILKGIVSNTKPDTDSSIVNPTCSDDNYALFTDVAKYLGKGSAA